MVLGVKLNKSLQNTLRTTNVWAKNKHVFKLSGAGHCAKNVKPDRLSPELRCSSLQSRSPEHSMMITESGSFGHLPIQTVRDVSTFEQVGGNEEANKKMLMEFYQKSINEHPGMDSTYY